MHNFYLYTMKDCYCYFHCKYLSFSPDRHQMYSTFNDIHAKVFSETGNIRTGLVDILVKLDLILFILLFLLCVHVF